ncbi:trimethyllysine dioxygenase [Hyaloraphidium curvatum]|nr:trimethyllysine dioxygenase [Hyaloraphidium curvatum]
MPSDPPTASEPAIAAAEPQADRLRVTWSDGVATEYPWVWLRDHAHDAETYLAATGQRQLFTAKLPDLVGEAAKVVAGGDGEELEVAWKTPAGGQPEKPSRLPLAFLRRFRVPRQASARVELPKQLWDAASFKAPTVPYAEVMASDAGVLKWLQLVAQYGFALVVGTPPTAEATEELVKKVAYIRETIFGGFWTFTADNSMADTAYTNLELRGHTDGTYSHDAPGLQLLHCLRFEGTGGESTMVDAFRIAEDIKREHPEHYRTLSTVHVPGQYIGDGSHLMASRPILRHGPDGQLIQVSFNNYDRAPFLLPADEHIAFYAALREFDLRANDRKYQWRHVLAPGEAMLFDNWRVLHGRDAYTGDRTLCGAYINHEDFESRLRMAGLF